MLDYTALFQDKLSFVPYIFLVAALLSLWVKRCNPLQSGLFLCAIVTGFLSGVLTILACAFIALLYGLIFLAFNHKNNIIRLLSSIASACIVVALFMHLAPGFINVRVASGIKLTPDSMPYSFYLNFDKAIAGFIILWLGFSSINKVKFSSSVLVRSLLVSAFAAVVLMFLSIFAHYVKFEPKWDNLFYIWALNNLIFVCIAEEMLFRGLIQNVLVSIMARLKHGKAIALIIASVIFGIAHVQGSILYAGIAAVAGLFYGGVYLQTNRIESGIIVHFLVNTIHLIFFSYPALQQ